MKEKIIAIVKSLKSIKLRRLMWIPVAVFIALLLYRFKGYIVAATVNGEPVSRVEVLGQLEKQGGKSILDSVITNKLILQAAKKEKITIGQQEITDQITQITNNLKAQGQDLDTALAAQGMTKKDLDDQIKLQIMVQKMAGKDINITDIEIEDYFKQNTAAYPKNTKLDSVKEEIRTTLKQQKLSEAITSWISDLKTKAKINYFVSY